MADTGRVTTPPHPPPAPVELSPSPRVLLVDDSAADRRAALGLLSSLGVAADEAEDGHAGVQRCVAGAYDVVLMDVHMPGMDGIEALRAIRTLLPAERRPRVVAVVAPAADGAHEAMLAVGFDGVCAKPFTALSVTDALRQPAPAFVARPAPERDAAAAVTADTLYQRVCAHVTDMLGEEDPEFVAELVESFSASSREAVADARATRDAGDVAGLASAAHRLKGSASNVGLTTIAAQWGTVEEAARGGAAPGGALDHALSETLRAVELLDARC